MAVWDSKAHYQIVFAGHDRKPFSKQVKKSKTLISSRAKINCSLVFLKEMQRWDRSIASTDTASTIISRRKEKYKHTGTIITSQIQ